MKKVLTKGFNDLIGSESIKHFTQKNTYSPSLSIIVPAKNEAGTIRKIVDELPDVGSMTEIIFIESDSSDNTLEEIKKVVAEYKGPKQLQFTSLDRPGKAEAVVKGFDMARGDICIIYDADMTVSSDEIKKIYEAAKTDSDIFINCSRFVYPMEKGAMRGFNYLGNKIFALIIGTLVGQKMTDTLCGTKVIYRNNFDKIKQSGLIEKLGDPFGDFTLILGAKKLGLKIIEIPVTYKKRICGITNISRFKDGWKLLKIVLKLKLWIE